MKTKFDKIQVLSNGGIFEGVKHSFNNSNNLFECARILKRNKKYNVATSILILSLEELMKSLALLDLLFLETGRRKFLKEIFESNNLHKSRHNFALIMNEYFKKVNLKRLSKTNVEITTPEDLADFILCKIDINKIIKNVDAQNIVFNNWFKQADEIKNSGLYVSHNNNKWFIPSRITEKEYLKSIKEIKKIRKSVSTIILMFIEIENSTEISFNDYIDSLKKTFSILEPKIGLEPIT